MANDFPSSSAKGVAARSKVRFASYFLASMACCLIFWLWSGVYEDDEFNEWYWFIKHRPTWQFVFVPTVHCCIEDVDLARLTPAELAAHERYRDFYRNRRSEVYLPIQR